MNGVDCCTPRAILASTGDLMRRQFVLDKRTNKLLEELASYRAGNRSMIVREAIQYYADMENELDKIESDPDFQKMIAQSDADIRAGRGIPHSEVVKAFRAKAAKRKKA
jgi:predicted transcriptional regulator